MPVRLPGMSAMCGNGYFREQVERKKHVMRQLSIPQVLVEGTSCRYRKGNAVFCGEYISDRLLKMGLQTLQEIEEKYAPKLFALDPHKLMRSIETLNLITYGRIVMSAPCPQSKNELLNFIGLIIRRRPREWNQYNTVKLEDGKVKTKNCPLITVVIL